jgi:F0F1-type ATP synthase assembly protein I
MRVSGVTKSPIRDCYSRARMQGTASSQFSAAGAGGVLLAVLAVGVVIGALIGWAAGSGAIGALLGAVFGILGGIFAVYKRYGS